MIRVLNLAYSEFKSIVIYIYNILFNIFLIPKVVLEYGKVLYGWPFLLGWLVLLLLIFYLKGYELIYYGRWSLIVFGFFKAWFEKDYINLYI